MHHEEDNPRHHHPHHWDLRHRRERHPHHEEHFQDARSRWGEPAPRINLHQFDDWQPHDVGRFEREGKYHQRKDDWLPDQGHHRQRRPPHPDHDQVPVWRQRDVDFRRENQHADDRWQQDDPLMPHPKLRHRRQGPPDEYWENYDR
ncbi:MAG: hypothetical protein LPK07_05455 [Hymenobacteraceae bacterium]|nr:hypothetical protein [Hymenobacteraceae bacterium]MDX5481108.1 hypothetical protein [Hymenobacteraceae bacterium]